MSKKVEIGSTLAAVAVFILLLVAAAATEYGVWGVIASVAAFVALVSLAGYLIAVEKYDVAEEDGEPEAGDAEAEAA